MQKFQLGGILQFKLESSKVIQFKPIFSLDLAFYFAAC